MKPIFQFVLLIFGVCLVIHLSVSKICGGEEYTVVYPNGTFKRCLPCGKCLPGLGLKPVCGNTLQHPPSTIDCQACKPGEFSSEFDSSPCIACHQCLKYELIKEHCTNKSDTVCSGKCKEGYYLSKTAPHDCQKCSSCCLDGKDEKIPECINQGLSKHCTCSARPDKVCGESCPADASKGGGLSTTTTIILIGGLSAGVIAILSIVTVVYYRRKRNGRLSQQPEVPAAREQRNGSAPYAIEGPQAELRATKENPLYHGTPVLAERSTSPHASRQAFNASEGPQSVSTDSKVTFCMPPVSSQKATYQGTPRGSHDELTGNKPVPSNARKHDNSSQNAATCSKIPSDEQVKLTDEKDTIKPPLGRQVSQDSQTSGDWEFRKRSLSARSFEMVERKMSLKKENSLLESEESDEPHEPIKISKHPNSQTVKEGSKVEFKCKPEKKNKNFLYQWYKDGVAELGQNDTKLVLDPVELRHFGRYTCNVSYRDSYGEFVESNPAILDVIPQRRNGMRPKRLDELDLNTREEIAALLGSKKFGLGDWRQVAAKYGMEDFKIGALVNIEKPGEALLEYIISSTLNLTVYDFCKVLKDDKIKRFDILKKLENHFLVSEQTKSV